MTNKEKEEVQKEIVDSLPALPHGRILVSPRVGKTKIAIDIIKREDPTSILWVTPLADLADIDIPLEFDTWKAKKFKKRLTTSTWASLSKVKGHFNMVILDEEQYATENNLSNFFNGELSADYIITLTGTPTKDFEKKLLYKRLDLSVLVEYDLNQAVEANMLSDYTINVIEIPMSMERNIKAGNKKKQFYISEVAQYDYLDSVAKKSRNSFFPVLNRMRAIYNSPAKLSIAEYLVKNLKGRKLIFSPSINAAEKLSPYTYHSKTDNKYLREFIEGKVDELSLVNAGGTGVTYKNINHLIISQSDSDNNGLTSQKIARALLEQGKDYKANIWILSLLGTEDTKWVSRTLSRFDLSKVRFIKLDRFKNILEYDSAENIDLVKEFPMFNTLETTKNVYNEN